MLLDTRVALLLGEKYLELPLPAARMARNPKTWGSVVELINGSSATVASELFSRALEFQWPQVDARGAESLRWLAYAGSASITYMDRAIQGSGNVLSPLLARPYLLASSLTPVAWGVDGQRLAEADKASGDVGIPALKFLPVTPSDKQSHEYEEIVLIPRGYDFWGLAQGVGIGNILSVNGIGAREGALFHVAGHATEHRIARVKVQHHSQGGTLKTVRAALLPLGGESPQVTLLQDFSDGQGMTVMSVQPGSFQESLTALHNGRAINSVSVVIQEVWPWL